MADWFIRLKAASSLDEAADLLMKNAANADVVALAMINDGMDIGRMEALLRSAPAFVAQINFERVYKAADTSVPHLLAIAKVAANIHIWNAQVHFTFLHNFWKEINADVVLDVLQAVFGTFAEVPTDDFFDTLPAALVDSIAARSEPFQLALYENWVLSGRADDAVKAAIVAAVQRLQQTDRVAFLIRLADNQVPVERGYTFVASGTFGCVYRKGDAVVKVTFNAAGAEKERAAAARVEEIARVSASVQHGTARLLEPRCVIATKDDLEKTDAKCLECLGRHAIGVKWEFAGVEIMDETHPERLPLPDTLTALANLANAISELHKYNVFHNDISNANVLLDVPRRRFVLIDFGKGTVSGQAERAQRAVTNFALIAGHSGIESNIQPQHLWRPWQLVVLRYLQLYDATEIPTAPLDPEHTDFLVQTLVGGYNVHGERVLGHGDLLSCVHWQSHDAWEKSLQSFLTTFGGQSVADVLALFHKACDAYAVAAFGCQVLEQLDTDALLDTLVEDVLLASQPVSSVTLEAFFRHPTAGLFGGEAAVDEANMRSIDCTQTTCALAVQVNDEPHLLLLFTDPEQIAAHKRVYEALGRDTDAVIAAGTVEYFASYPVLLSRSAREQCPMLPPASNLDAMDFEWPGWPLNKLEGMATTPKVIIDASVRLLHAVHRCNRKNVYNVNINDTNVYVDDKTQQLRVGTWFTGTTDGFQDHYLDALPHMCKSSKRHWLPWQLQCLNRVLVRGKLDPKKALLEQQSEDALGVLETLRRELSVDISDEAEPAVEAFVVQMHTSSSTPWEILQKVLEYTDRYACILVAATLLCKSGASKCGAALARATLLQPHTQTAEDICRAMRKCLAAV